VVVKESRLANYNLPGKMITTSEAAVILHLNVNTVRRWADKGILKGYILGRRGDRRFVKADVLEIANKNRPR
jgi:excisionase family DNA binding protein